tara:strand:- start:356 stop:823 length:468 start_codon:yes stop_codon:yes gene_type:complete
MTNEPNDKNTNTTDVNIHQMQFQQQPAIKKVVDQTPIKTPDNTQDIGIDIEGLKKNVKQILGNNSRVRFTSKDGQQSRNPKQEFKVSNTLIELIERKSTGKVHIKFEIKTNKLKKSIGTGDFEEQPVSAFEDFGNKIIAISEKCAKNQMLMFEEK